MGLYCYCLIGLARFAHELHRGFPPPFSSAHPRTLPTHKMADKLRTLQNLEALQARYIGTGHADTTKYEWTSNILRDSYASYVGHNPLLSYMSVGMGEPKEKVRVMMLEKMVRGAGNPPEVRTAQNFTRGENGSLTSSVLVSDSRIRADLAFSDRQYVDYPNIPSIHASHRHQALILSHPTEMDNRVFHNRRETTEAWIASQRLRPGRTRGLTTHSCQLGS